MYTDNTTTDPAVAAAMDQIEAELGQAMAHAADRFTDVLRTLPTGEPTEYTRHQLAWLHSSLADIETNRDLRARNIARRQTPRRNERWTNHHR